MTQDSLPWNEDAVGDAGPYTDDNWTDMYRKLFLADRTTEGVLEDYLNELEVSGTTSPITIETGAAVVDGKFYENDSAETEAIAAPAANTRIDRVVLRKSWAAQTVRYVVLSGIEGGGVPSLTQLDGTTWEIPIAQVSITTGGAITVTDERSMISTFGSGGTSTGSGLSAEAYWGKNLIRNFPSLELADDAQPEWWNTTNDEILHEVDCSGESIPEKHERAIKLTVSADGGGADYAYQAFDEADEQILDDNVTTVSTGAWVYQKSTDTAGTITLELYDDDAAASLGIDTTTAQDAWTFLEVKNITYQDSMMWRITHSANGAVVYFTMPALNVGATVTPWKSRRFDGPFETSDSDIVNGVDPGGAGWTDVDLTASIGNLGVAAFLGVRYDNDTDNKSIYIRPNGSSGSNDAYRIVTNPVAGKEMLNQSYTLLDDSQIFEYYSSAPGANVESLSIAVLYYWRWA